MTAAQALRAAVVQLTAAGIAGAARDARLLLAHAMQIAPDRVTLHLPDAMTPDAMARLELALGARAAHQPIAQITGQRLFWGRSFAVSRDTLDPRPETELLVQRALAQPFETVLDLGTGTGCILLSLLADRPEAQGVGCDISVAALAVAARNAQSLGVQSRASFQLSDWFSAVQGQFDLIVSNPPYIAAAEMADLARDVRDWEPHLALTPGGDGLQPYRIIAAKAGSHLRAGGRLMVEIGPTQAAAVAGFFSQHGFDQVAVLQDMDGRDRVVLAVKPQ
jgi:release factor glutamine methyltransferase